MSLWSNGVPFYRDGEFIPDILEYPADGSKGAVIVFAGGAYCQKAEHEGAAVAQWLNSIGVTAFVSDYRIAPEYHHPAMLADAQRSVRYVRSRASELGFSPDKIAVMGFSAGGHLAGSVSVHYNKKIYEPTDRTDGLSARPDASILCYPVIDMFEYRHDGSRQNLLRENPSRAEKELMSLYMQVDKNTPEAFIWHTSEDAAVPVQNSLMYANALAEVQVPFELHIFPHGHHGLGLAAEEPHVAQWKGLLDNWLSIKGWK